MKKQFLNLMAVVLALVFTAFSVKTNWNQENRTLALAKRSFGPKTKVTSLKVFEYLGGPQYNPNSYVKVPNFVYISSYCPGDERLCAILAEEDLFSNPGHPTQASLNYLLNYFGFYYFFPNEVSGLIEFRWENE